MKLLKLFLEFIQKVSVLTPKEKQSLNEVLKMISRKGEYKRTEGFIKLPQPVLGTAKLFVYEPKLDTRVKKHLTGPYFRIWFTEEKNGIIFLVDLEKL